MMRVVEGDWMVEWKVDEDDDEENLAMSVYERRLRREKRIYIYIYI